MSRLFLSERGRVLLGNSEEITHWRWARKRCDRPAAAAGAAADVWLLTQMYEDNRRPLHVLLGGKPLGRIEPDARLASFPVWSRVEVPAGRLVGGTNEIELRSAAPAMNAWMLAVEPGHCNTHSLLSTDRGKTWRVDHMGYNNILRGEYVVRLRVHSPLLSDPAPPAIAYEDPSHPRVKQTLELAPAAIRDQTDPWKQLLALRTWVARSWSHRCAGPVYTPWDPWTILDWGKRDRGQGRRGVVCMCVHFATLFVALASALGHRARCVVIAERLDEPSGHFMAEAWDERRGQWVLHDPNYDVHYNENGRLLSAIDLAERSHQCQSFYDWVAAGEGMPGGPPRVVDAFKNHFASGKSFRMTGVWSMNQFVSDPTKSPTVHGSVAYCEPEIVWYHPPEMDFAPMFPYHAADRGYFDADAEVGQVPRT